jgi:protein involved in polysaccharide export with SLBB domain
MNMELIKLSQRGLLALALLFTTLLLAACSSIDPNYPLGPDTGPANDPSGAALRVGDELDVQFFNIPAYPALIVDTIKEDGSITLIHGEKFQAEHKTVNQLRNEVTKRYVPNYYNSIDFTIVTPKRTFSVGGEVKAGGSFQYPNQRVTLTQAINLAAGLTDFARHKIQVTRWTGGKPIIVNYDQAIADSTKDLEIYPGDIIIVPRRLF